MFKHGWTNYLQHAWPADELKPVSCQGVNTQGGYMLTLVDAADMLAIMGETTLFRQAVSLMEQSLTFDLNKTVSVFETNIRMLGGLLSAHILATRLLPDYSGTLLRLATDLGDRLMRAFGTPTGIPYGSVNLRYGAHINVLTGTWTEQTSGIAGSLDSFYEYLFKTYLVFHDDNFYAMFASAYHAVEQHGTRSGWHFPIDMFTGGVHRAEYYSLQAFWPGLQVLYGDLRKAVASVTQIAHLHYWLPFLPESIDVIDRQHTENRGYPLRPEAVESLYMAYRAVKDHGLLNLAYALVDRLYRHTQTPCGFSGVEDVSTMALSDHMDSFFLSETLKYLYLMFDDDNFLNRKEMHWVFTTEAHPLPILVNNQQRKRRNHAISNLPLRRRPSEPFFGSTSSRCRAGPSSPILQGRDKPVCAPLRRPPRPKPQAKAPEVTLSDTCSACEWRYVTGALAWTRGRSWEDVDVAGNVSADGTLFLRDWGHFDRAVDLNS
ncbi:hypothetical protein RI367_007453 [Sorochytrium milnesiophthora]